MTQGGLSDAEALEVPPEVFHQLEALRDSGAVNMITDVRHGLREMGFDEAYDWVSANREAYFKHAMRGGFKPAEEAADE